MMYWIFFNYYNLHAYYLRGYSLSVFIDIQKTQISSNYLLANLTYVVYVKPTSLPQFVVSSIIFFCGSETMVTKTNSFVNKHKLARL